MEESSIFSPFYTSGMMSCWLGEDHQCRALTKEFPNHFITRRVTLILFSVSFKTF